MIGRYLPCILLAAGAVTIAAQDDCGGEGHATKRAKIDQNGDNSDPLVSSPVACALLKAKEQFGRKEFGCALSVLRAIEASTPEEKAAVQILMGQCYEGNSCACAFAAYRKALSIAPTVSESLLRLGVLEFKAGSIDEAKSHLERYVEVAPGNPEAFYYLYLVYAMLDDDGQEKCLREVILLDGPDCYWLTKLKRGQPDGN